ncbi:hypothetical protein FNV43_RR03471 [Rhamnella rubrinervis]|uniref:Uncharacterized protein n=1 Tax=Rhamnella rubrinervis TaxID=2594499 RepID=A0A8K0MPC1_9ROSA|nr:hypothetical protein FNV43_RR03471 [Rhamnella rubrinervis]
MRHYSIMGSLLLLCLLLSEVQGIRLEKGFMAAGVLGHHRIQKEETDSVKTSNGGMGVVTSCKDGHCSGNNRKLISVTTSSTTTTSSKNEKTNGTNRSAHEPNSNKERGDGQDGDKEVNFKAKSSSTTDDEHREVPNEQYPDVTDLAEMDYSPARRKPPIHN